MSFSFQAESIKKDKMGDSDVLLIYKAQNSLFHFYILA